MNWVPRASPVLGWPGKGKGPASGHPPSAAEPRRSTAEVRPGPENPNNPRKPHRSRFRWPKIAGLGKILSHNKPTGRSRGPSRRSMPSVTVSSTWNRQQGPNDVHVFCPAFGKPFGEHARVARIGDGGRRPYPVFGCPKGCGAWRNRPAKQTAFFGAPSGSASDRSRSEPTRNDDSSGAHNRRTNQRTTGRTNKAQKRTGPGRFGVSKIGAGP